MSEKFYKVNLDELTDLLESEWLLTKLQNAGVDNWPGYEESGINDFEDRDWYIEEGMEYFEEVSE